MTILSLGTNGFFPSYGRETACYAIPLEKTLIILDAGSGFFRLAGKEGQKLLKKAKEVHLFLSHYHFDHTFGFYAAFEILKDKKVTVFAPTAREVFSEFPQLGYFPIDYVKKYANFKWIALSEGKHKVSSYQVSVKKQNHRGEVSLAFCFNFGIAYATDGEPTREIVDFVNGVPLLLHEHWFSGEKLRRKNVPIEDHVFDGHVTTAGTATIAKEAKVGKLALIHHHPFADNQQLKKQLKLAKSIFPRTILALDLRTISL